VHITSKNKINRCAYREGKKKEEKNKGSRVQLANKS